MARLHSKSVFVLGLFMRVVFEFQSDTLCRSSDLPEICLQYRRQYMQIFSRHLFMSNSFMQKDSLEMSASAFTDQTHHVAFGEFSSVRYV